MERAQYLPQRLVKPSFAIGLIWINHFFGLLGAFWQPMVEGINQLTPFSSFIELTPLNLLITGFLLLYYHSQWTVGHLLWVFIAFLTGYGVEVLGVHTGLVFGEYAYGPVLGWKMFDVPLTIGLNWMILVYVSGILIQNWQINQWLKAAVMASMLTLLDVAIEPVAIYWDFWSWGGVVVPIQNYIAWWLIAFVLAYLWLQLFRKPSNKLAIHIWWAQVFFFVGNNVLIYT